MNHTGILYFDVETGPLPEDELRALEPVFEPGLNLKDPEKIKADIERKRQRWLDQVALSALTGQVLAIGLANNDESVQILWEGREADLIQTFWRVVNSTLGTTKLCGFCISSFDLPFLFQRSWRHGIEPPFYLRNNRWWSERVLDLREVWCLGQRDMAGSLADVARLLGLPPKLGEGSEFARLLAADKEAALAYLTRDIEITRALAARIEPSLVKNY